MPSGKYRPIGGAILVPRGSHKSLESLADPGLQSIDLNQGKRHPAPRT
jgi:hypothetical protein